MDLMREGLGFLQTGNYMMAEESYASALEIAQTAFGDDHPTTTSLLGYLARSCLAQKKIDLAATMLERQLCTLRALKIARPAEQATTMMELADCLRQLDRGDEADKLVRESGAMMAQIEHDLKAKHDDDEHARAGLLEGDGDSDSAEEEADEDCKGD